MDVFLCLRLTLFLQKLTKVSELSNKEHNSQYRPIGTCNTTSGWLWPRLSNVFHYLLSNATDFTGKRPGKFLYAMACIFRQF